MSNEKAMIIRSIVELIRKMLYSRYIKMSQYFTKVYKPLGGDIIVKLDLSNFETKTDLENATGIDTSNLAAKSDLTSVKVEVDKLDEDKLKTVPVDLSKLSNAVNNEVLKKTVFHKLAAKVNAIDTKRFVLKTKDDTDKSDLEKKINEADKNIPDTSGVLEKQIIMLKSLKYKTKYLATSAALTSVEN